MIGGICSNTIKEIDSCYNRGDVILRVTTINFGDWPDAAGIKGQCSPRIRRNNKKLLQYW